MGKGKKYSYGHGGGMMRSMMMPKKMVMKDGGQALFDALKKKGYKKMGGQTKSNTFLFAFGLCIPSPKKTLMS